MRGKITKSGSQTHRLGCLKELYMIDVNRINELARKSKTPEGLTEEEKLEQAKLRREYIDSFKRSLVSQLDNTYIVEEDGTKHKVQKKN